MVASTVLVAPVQNRVTVAANAVRERLLVVVRESPGLNKSALSARLGVAWGTVAYHVHILAASGQIEVEARGREANLFPRGLHGSQRRLMVALRDPQAAAIIDALGAARQLGLQDLAGHLGLSRKVVRRHLGLLLEVGLVEDKGTRRPRYAMAGWPTGARTPALQVRQPALLAYASPASVPADGA